jgi:hypothetical protein
MATTDTKLVTGNTYPVKDQLRAMGGTWDAHAKGWRVPADRYEDARAIVLTRPARRTGSRYGSRYTRFMGGAEVFTNARGRCEDAPCCGCCS